MSREDLELENITKIIQEVKYVGMIAYYHIQKDWAKAIATAILTWHKQREVELLEGLQIKMTKLVGGLPSDIVEVFQQAISERMVGK